MTEFRCRRCGAACRQILHEVEGHLFGIYLEPEEVSLFPAGSVFPLFGTGDPVVATAYQLGVDRCPNYSEAGGLGTCGVYDRRPLVCRAFPVISRGVLSQACPAVRASQGVESKSLAEELRAHGEKMQRRLDGPPNEWVWPLNERRWIKLGDAAWTKS